MNWMGVILVIGVLSSGCGMGTLYISGDEDAVGAEIFIDGQKKGSMEKGVYERTFSSDPVLAERQRKEDESLGIRQGQVYATASIWVSNGEHELMLISVNGKRLSKRFQMRGENYMNVSFGKMIIEGE